MIRSKIGLICREGLSGLFALRNSQSRCYQHFLVSSSIGQRLTPLVLYGEPIFNVRWFSDSNASSLTSGEEYLTTKLREKIPECLHVEVRDVSGGCGEMYEIYVVSPSFKGITILAQHKMVTDALKDDIPKFHGVRVATSSFLPSEK